MLIFFVENDFTVVQLLCRCWILILMYYRTAENLKLENVTLPNKVGLCQVSG